MNSPLTLIPAKVRLMVYLTYFLLTLGFSSVGAYFLALHQQVPDWAIGGAAAIVPIGAAFAAVAASNTSQMTPVDPAGVQNVFNALPVDVPPPPSAPTEPATTPVEPAAAAAGTTPAWATAEPSLP